MFPIKTFADVVAVAKTFGPDALSYAFKNSTLNQDANNLITSCFCWASNPTVAVESFNDGNNCYEVEAIFTRGNLAGFFTTSLDDIEIIRTGFGAYRMPVRQALEKKEINHEQMMSILNSIHARNAAADALGIER